jgi:exodeoxyribonuclease V beta subunit
MSTRRIHSSATKPTAWLSNFRSEQVRALDPKYHALIEASAGTGKTFAIEHLVLRLLVENPTWNPEELLLLSFTKKTVAEMRDRIRSLLRAQLDDSEPSKRIEGWSPAERERIRQLWLHADDLSIQTLDAFCQSALKRDPVENNALLQTTLVDDVGLAEVALDRLLRTTWAKDPARLARLANALGMSSGGASGAWRRTLIRIALAWLPWRRDTLDPAGDPGTLEPLETAADEAVSLLPAAFAAIERSTYAPSDHRKSFELTPTGKARKNPDVALRKDPYQKVLVFAETWQPDKNLTRHDTTNVLKFFRTTFNKAAVVVNHGWESALPVGAAGLPEWVTLAQVCQRVRTLCDEVEHARLLQTYGLLAEAARELRAALDDEKLQRGLISYADMPRQLVEALRRNPGLAPRLAARYKACIVDEFQDTDPLQWEILEALCLRDEAGNGNLVGAQIPKTHDHPPALPLFLVGDPKQAIYSFRGSDLRTYMMARDRMRTLAGLGRAQGIGLDANHRSRKPLIDALNTTFAHDGWFGAPPAIPPDGTWQLPAVSDPIAFTPVHAGRTDHVAANEPAIILRDFAAEFSESLTGKKKASKTEVEQAVRWWTASRIIGALRNDSQVKPGDFAVLTRTNAEGLAIARLLRRRGVPCRIIQRGGPFHGPAADALRLLLAWIDDAANPDAQARILMLPFARAEDEFPKGRPDRCPPLIARWAALAKAGQWPEFLGAVLHEGGFRERLAAESESEATRFDRLIELLSEAASTPGLSTHAVTGRFDAMRRGEDVAESEEDGLEDADESGAVTVMTLHLSKGLEFKHVFIASSGGGVKDDFLVLRDSGTLGFRIALNKSGDADQAQADQQSHEENKRIFYVAFTRARESLYVPLLPDSFNRADSGPLGGFAASALRAATHDAALASIVQFDTAPVHHDTYTAPYAPAPLITATPQRSRDTLLAEARAVFTRRRTLTSYSRLALRAGEVVSEPLLEDDGSRVQRQEPVNDVLILDQVEVVGAAIEGISASDLPPGAATGTALHALLEHTVFASVLAAPSPEAWLNEPGQRARVEETLKHESVDPACAPAAARAVWNALRSPLPEPGKPEARHFRLADLTPSDLRHEVEFLLSYEALGLTSQTPSQGGHETHELLDRLPDGITMRSTSAGIFLWGFIDLVFRHEGRYYVLDWKSNLLDSYDDQSVQKSMDHHRYHLQWKLYAVALDRWLSARVEDYDPEQHFGGVHYLFLRGATPERFAGYAARPTRDDLRVQFPNEISRLLGVTPEGPLARPQTAEARAEESP